MEEIIITALILGAGYYFYLNQSKEAKESPLMQTTSTQTKPLTNSNEKELEKTLDTLIKNIQQLNKQLK